MANLTCWHFVKCWHLSDSGNLSFGLTSTTRVRQPSVESGTQSLTESFLVMIIK